MKGSRASSIRYFGVFLVFMFSAGCGSISSFASATEVLPTSTPAPTAAPTSIPYSIFEELGTFQGSSDGIASMAFSPDGTILAYGDYGDSLVTMIDVSTGKTIKTLEGHTAPVSALAFTPDGLTLASTGTVNLPPGKDGSVRLWDVQTGKQLAVFQTTGTSALTFSPDGTLLAGSVLAPVQFGQTNQVQVILWDVQSRSQSKTFKDVFNSLSFSPDGSLLATSARDNAIHIFDVQSGNETMTLSAHTDLVSAVAYSADGKLLASGGWDQSIYLWQTVNGNQLKTLTGHEGGVSLVGFSPEGNVLVSLGDGFATTSSGGQITLAFVDEDKFLRFWDTTTGQQIGEIRMSGGISAAAFNADWSMIATADSSGVIQLWKANP
jgi:WD40 repeat protein